MADTTVSIISNAIERLKKELADGKYANVKEITELLGKTENMVVLLNRDRYIVEAIESMKSCFTYLNDHTVSCGFDELPCKDMIMGITRENIDSVRDVEGTLKPCLILCKEYISIKMIDNKFDGVTVIGGEIFTLSDGQCVKYIPFNGLAIGSLHHEYLSHGVFYFMKHHSPDMVLHYYSDRKLHDQSSMILHDTFTWNCYEGISIHLRRIHDDEWHIILCKKAVIEEPIKVIFDPKLTVKENIMKLE
jgi:hypothetical protein